MTNLEIASLVLAGISGKCLAELTCIAIAARIDGLRLTWRALVYSNSIWLAIIPIVSVLGLITTCVIMPIETDANITIILLGIGGTSMIGQYWQWRYWQKKRQREGMHTFVFGRLIKGHLSPRSRAG